MFFKSITPDFYQTLLDLHLAENENLLILAGEKSGLDYSKLQSTFAQKAQPFWGGFFPSIIGDSEQSAESVLVLKLPMSADPILVSMEAEKSIEEQGWFQNKQNETGALMVLVDGLSARVEAFLYQLQSMFPADLPILGGGAGSLTLEQAPCLFDQNGIQQNVALLAPIT